MLRYISLHQQILEDCSPQLHSLAQSSMDTGGFFFCIPALMPHSKVGLGLLLPSLVQRDQNSHWPDVKLSSVELICCGVVPIWPRRMISNTGNEAAGREVHEEEPVFV